MLSWKTNGKTLQVFVALGLLLLAVPLFLAVAWGDHFGNSAFITFQAAQRLASSFNSQAPDFVPGTVTQAPLFAGFLAAAGKFAPQVGLVISALGWSAAAFLMFISLRAAGRPLAAIITPILLVFNPLVITTSGTEISWVVALGWAALALTVFSWGSPRRAVWLKLVLLLLLLGLHFNATTILFALALLAIDVYNGRVGWLLFILVAVASFLWGFFMIPRSGSSPNADPLLWLQNGTLFITNRQLYWLYVPFIAAGLWDVWRWENGMRSAECGMWNDFRIPNPEYRIQEGGSRNAPQEGRLFFVLLILWAAAAVLARSMAAPAIAAVTAVALSGLGAAWFTRRILASGRLEIEAMLVPVLITAPLLLVSLVTLWDRYSTRPVQQAALQDQAAAWLLQNADPEATLYAPPRAGFQAGLATIPALVEQIRDDNVDGVYDQLLDYRPDFIVAEDTFAWDYLTRTTWFKDRYQVRAQFKNGYAANSPVTIWGYTPSPFDEGQREAITAVVDERFALVGYQFEPKVIKPGDDVFLTLYLQALEPVDHGFITGVHLSAPDGWVWAWREERTPRSLSGQWWEPGQVIPERIRLLTTEDIPLSAYDLQVFWRDGDDKSNLQITRDEAEVFDRIFLGRVVAPSPVDTEAAAPVKAQFGESILLDSYEISTLPVPGQPLDVTLNWQALSSPTADYTVFVHLIDAQGQVVAAHDSMPGENSYPTEGWPPGLLVSDRHPLDLPADLPPGDYQVHVGLYLLQTGERLPVWDAGGVEQVDRSLPLATVTVTGNQ